VVVIPVAPQPEPTDFDLKVRQPGLRWIKKQGLDPAVPVPTGTEIPSHWTKCLPDLRRLYNEVCAYTGLFVPKVTGAPTVEHFAPKSKRLSLAFEWTNYRFVCAKINSRKRDFEDVLDPFVLQVRTFELNLINGGIAPGNQLNVAQAKKARATIERLDLDDAECREVRLEYIDEFTKKNISEDYLKRKAPFVWFEMKRQGWL
jgi:uncharacterized protein (TIGR02646 family)